MASTIGTLKIEIEAGIARLERDMKQAARSVESASNSIKGAISGVQTAFAALAAVVGVGAFGALVRQSFEAIDANAKLADRLGITTQTLAGLQHAANLANVSQQTLITASRHLATGISEAAAGTGEAKRAFDMLGLSAQNLLRLPMDQQLSVIIDRLRGVENVTQRNALAADIFGARATEMLNLISGGSQALQEAAEDAKAWGLALDRVDSAKVEAANDAILRVQGAAKGVSNTIAVVLSPVIADLAERFASAAKESGGFRDTIQSVLDWIVKGAAFAADAIRGLQVVWEGLKVGVANALNVVIQSVTSIDQAFTDLWNKIAGSWAGEKLGLVKAQYSRILQEIAEISRTRVAEIEDSFEQLALQELPSGGILEWYARVQEGAQKAAEAVAEAAPKINQGAVLAVVQDDGFAKLQEQLRARIGKLAESQLTERQQLEMHLAEQQRMLDEAFVLGLISEQRQKELLEELELQHQAKLGDIEAQGILARRRFAELNSVQQTQFVLGQLLQLTQGVATHNRAMFTLNKIAAIANAVINTSEGVTKALSAYPPPLSFAMAAAQLAAGMAQVQQIRAAQFGGTSAPSIGGGGAIPVTPAETPAPPPAMTTQEPAREPRVVHIQLEGSGVVSDEWIRNTLIPAINDAIGDGVTIQA